MTKLHRSFPMNSSQNWDLQNRDLRRFFLITGGLALRTTTEAYMLEFLK